MINNSYMRLVSSMNKTSIVYLLDTYTFSKAYSLRRLSSTFASDVVNIRRSSDSAEAGFTPEEVENGTMLTWVGTTGSDNGYVTSIANQGTLASSALVQATASNQPKIVSAGVTVTKNGKTSMYFDGTNDFLGSSATGIFPQGALSFFGVASAFATETNGFLFSADNGSGVGSRYGVLADTRTTPNRSVAINNGTTTYLADLSTPRVDTNQHLLVGFNDSSKNMSAFDNGATGGTDTYTGTYGNTRLRIGLQLVSSNRFNGDFQELLIADSDLSADRSAIETDINDYYSIY